MNMKTIETIWEMRTYDVWGNAKDGYEVNDVYPHGDVTLRIPVTVHNVGTPHEFKSAHPTFTQLRSVFGVSRVQLQVDGDDMNITVNRLRDSYPIGELSCVSHESLSPIREKSTK
jgi:hypothetical protein